MASTSSTERSRRVELLVVGDQKALRDTPSELLIEHLLEVRRGRAATVRLILREQVDEQVDEGLLGQLMKVLLVREVDPRTLIPDARHLLDSQHRLPLHAIDEITLDLGMLEMKKVA
jgi:hypothetical protein